MSHCETGKELIDSYVLWLKDRFSFDQVDGGCEITTPFLDRHNDSIVIYLIKKGDSLVLTDDGYTFADLKMSGFGMTDRRKGILTTILNGLGVEFDEDNEELFVRVSENNAANKKHSLVQAIISVNDMFLGSQPYVKALFLEEVLKYFKENEIRYSQGIKIPGKSGIDHAFDIVIPSSSKQPERLIQAIGSPGKESVVTKILFPYHDIVERRPSTIFIGILNDTSKIGSDLTSYIKNTGVTPILWSQRERYLEQLQT
jgi:hypothetical protein